MNHLAHLYLSRHSEEMMVGNFIADAVKGRKYLEYEEQIAKGILMHRAIDSFTDSNDIVHHSKKFLRGRYGLFSSILVDLFYDHFLAVNWIDYSDKPLSEFAEQCYKVFERFLAMMPERNRMMFPYMQKENWLLNYAGKSGIRRSLNGMSRRIKNHPGIENGYQELELYYEELNKDFKAFFPLLEGHVKDYVK